MKIDCIEKFNIEMLRKGIAEFEVVEGKEPYTIMSRDTLYMLKKEIERELLWISMIRQDGKPLASFEGIIIFTNDDLPLGVVDLR